MTNTAMKLERGTTLLLEASGDQDLLGVALLAFQGALDTRLRELLSSNTGLNAADQTLLADPRLSIPQLVELARRYGDLNREQAWRILEAERLRTTFSSGEPFRGSPNEVRAYGRFAAEICGDPQLAAELASIPSMQLTPASDTAVQDDDDADPAPAGLYYTLMNWVPGLLLAAVLVIGAWMLLGRTSLTNQTVVPPPNVAPADPLESSSVTSIPADATLGPVIVGQVDPTTVPSPTAAAHQGRITRLGGGPGWLHESARFDSPTLPIRLSEGQIVTILGQQQTDSQGTPWMYVAIGGYEGWSPVNNIEVIR